jgi:hypothetical protein
MGFEGNYHFMGRAQGKPNSSLRMENDPAAVVSLAVNLSKTSSNCA